MDEKLDNLSRAYIFIAEKIVVSVDYVDKALRMLRKYLEQPVEYQQAIMGLLYQLWKCNKQISTERKPREN